MFQHCPDVRRMVHMEAMRATRSANSKDTMPVLWSSIQDSFDASRIYECHCRVGDVLHRTSLDEEALFTGAAKYAYDYVEYRLIALVPAASESTMRAASGHRALW